MKIRDSNHYKFNSSAYQLNESNFIVAVKDAIFPDRNIVPLYYKSIDDDLLLEIDEDEIGNKIFIKRGNDTVTPDLDTRFFLNEMFKVYRGPFNHNDRYEMDHNVPKKWTYKNKLQSFSPNEIIEIFQAQLDESKSRILIENAELRDLISNTYIRDNQVFFVEYGDRQLGPFTAKRSDTGYFIVEKSFFFGKFGLFNFSNADFLEINVNGINRKIINEINSIPQAFIEAFDFSSDDEVISWFNTELASKGNELFINDELNQLKSTLEKVINNNDLNRDTIRYTRISKILSTSKNLVISRQNLLNILPELSVIKEEIESQEKKGLELRNDIEKKLKEIENSETLLTGKKEQLLELDKKIIESNEKKEEQRKKLEEELENRISGLKQEIAQLDEKLKTEREIRSGELNVLKEDIVFQERRKDELNKVIETLRKEFIEDQKNAQEKLVELVRHKTHFDFISGKDLSISENNKFEGASFIIEKNKFEEYKDLREGVNEIFKTQLRYFSNHFIDNLLICIHQNTLTILAGLPGTGKTSLAKIISSALTQANRIKEIPLGRGWTSQKDLIGFSNPISKNFYESQTGLYRLLKQLNYEWEAESYLDSPLAFVILDEANLSPMEHYWSTFYNSTDSYALKDKPMKIDLGQSEVIKYANTLRFIGTINYDQTTEELSPRILDRINIIRLKPNQNQIESVIVNDIETLNISFKKCINFFKLFDFNNENLDISMPEKMKDKYEEIKKIFEKINIYISPRVEIGIKRYCQIANTIMTEEYRPLDYCIAQRLLPLINIQGDKRNELEELKIIIKNFKLEESVSFSILENIIQIGSKDGYTKDNYNYFLTLTHV